MALLMLLLTAWVALGIAVLLLLNLAKWMTRDVAPTPADPPPVEHSLQTREPARRSS